MQYRYGCSNDAGTGVRLFQAIMNTNIVYKCDGGPALTLRVQDGRCVITAGALGLLQVKSWTALPVQRAEVLVGAAGSSNW